MTREATRLVAAFRASVLATAFLAACGGSDSAPDSVSSEKSAVAETEGGSKGDAAGAQQGAEPDSPAASRPVDAAPLRISGGGSAELRVEGGDNSIQEFGEESTGSELEQAATAVHDYYVARAEADWEAGCSYLAESMIRRFEAFASRSEQLKGEDCAGMLEVFTTPLPEPMRRESTQVDAASLRRDGERAYLIYRAAKGVPHAILVAQEDGDWKVAALNGYPLP